MITTLTRIIRRIVSGRISVSGHTKQQGEIEPDEIFLDSSNLPEFNTSQFEGRLEHPISKKTLFAAALFFFAIGMLFVGRAWNLQVQNGDAFAALSENNRLRHSLIFAERGVIYDRNGAELVWNVPNEKDDFSHRKYYQNPGFAHLLGYVSYPKKDEAGFYYQEDFVGKTGLEESFSHVIAGVNGLKIVETDAFASVQSESVFRPPTDGKNLVLSIDARIQEKLYEQIADLANRIGFVGGASVIMDVENGEVLALVSFPEYDSNIVSGGEEAESIQNYREDDRKPFLNRVLAGLYTPGSIVKPFLALGALREDIIAPDKKILSTGQLIIPNPYTPEEPSIFRDWKAHGFTNMQEAIAVSSDVYFYEIGGGLSATAAARAGVEAQEGLGIENIEKYLRMFGFGEESGIAFSTEAVGVIPNPVWKEKIFSGDQWRIGDTYNTSIGQYGLLITPIQAVRAVAALGNGGVLLEPTIVLGGERHVEQLPTQKEDLEIIKGGMRLAVTVGTAQGLYVPYVDIAAKTGTAEVGLSKKLVNSWIIGFFPYKNPRYAFVMLMERGPSENTIGGLYVARQLFDWMAVHTPEYFKPAD